MTLSQRWADGLRTLHGLTAHGFPNCFFVGRNQSATTVNLPLALDNQTRHTAYLITESRRHGYNTLEPTAEAEDEYVQEVRRLSVAGSRFYTECTPGYYNSEGAAGNKNGFFSEVHGAGNLVFFERLKQWREDGGLPGFALS